MLFTWILSSPVCPPVAASSWWLEVWPCRTLWFPRCCRWTPACRSTLPALYTRWCWSGCVWPLLSLCINKTEKTVVRILSWLPVTYTTVLYFCISFHILETGNGQNLPSVIADLYTTFLLCLIYCEICWIALQDRRKLFYHLFAASIQFVLFCHLQLIK